MPVSKGFYTSIEEFSTPRSSIFPHFFVHVPVFRCVCNTAKVLTREFQVPEIPGVHIHVSVFGAICCSRACSSVSRGCQLCAATRPGCCVAWSLADIAELDRLAAQGLAATAIYKRKRGIWPRLSIMKKFIQFKKTGSAKNNYRGRGDKLRQGHLDFADAEMELHPQQSVADSARASKAERGVACSRTTVWRVMRLKHNRHACKIHKCPKLTCQRR